MTERPDEKRSATDAAMNDKDDAQPVTPDAETQVDSLPESPPRKLKPGEKWKSKEVHTIPKNNLKIVFPA
jgi:hypothetical protein